jgi:hypothetical protein
MRSLLRAGIPGPRPFAPSASALRFRCGRRFRRTRVAISSAGLDRRPQPPRTEAPSHPLDAVVRQRFSGGSQTSIRAGLPRQLRVERRDVDAPDDLSDRRHRMRAQELAQSLHAIVGVESGHPAAVHQDSAQRICDTEDSARIAGSNRIQARRGLSATSPVSALDGIRRRHVERAGRRLGLRRLRPSAETRLEEPCRAEGAACSGSAETGRCRRPLGVVTPAARGDLK